MWIAYFVFPGLPFWIFCSILSILLIFGLEDESTNALVFLTIVGAAVLGVFGQLTTGIKLLFMHPGIAIAGIAAYFVVGAIYSVVKLVSHIASIRRKYHAFKCDFLDFVEVAYTGRNPEIPEEHKNKWTKIIRGSSSYEPSNMTYSDQESAKRFALGLLKASDNKRRITRWIIWWPWSALWTIINDPIRRIANEIYILLSKTYEGIVTRMRGKIDGDLVKPASDDGM